MHCICKDVLYYLNFLNYLKIFNQHVFFHLRQYLSWVSEPFYLWLWSAQLCPPDTGEYGIKHTLIRYEIITCLKVSANQTLWWQWCLQVETKAEREARGRPVGRDVPYAAMGGLTGFTSLLEGYLTLEASTSGIWWNSKNKT